MEGSTVGSMMELGKKVEDEFQRRAEEAFSIAQECNTSYEGTTKCYLNIGRGNAFTEASDIVYHILAEMIRAEMIRTKR